MREDARPRGDVRVAHAVEVELEGLEPANLRERIDELRQVDRGQLHRRREAAHEPPLELRADLGRPLEAMRVHHRRGAPLVFQLSRVPLRERGRLDLQANELSSRVTALHQPVGVDQPWDVVVRVRPDVLGEVFLFVRRHGARVPLSGDALPEGARHHARDGRDHLLDLRRRNR